MYWYNELTDEEEIGVEEIINYHSDVIYDELLMVINDVIKESGIKFRDESIAAEHGLVKFVTQYWKDAPKRLNDKKSGGDLNER